MSGSGRKSQYRKSVTSAYLSDDSREPSNNESIVNVVGNRGDNTFLIRFPNENQELANLPKKFNKLIWIKTGDFIIVEDDNMNSNVNDCQINTTSHNKIKYTIVHILSKPNIKYLKANNLWPSEFLDGHVMNKIIDLPSDYPSNYNNDEELEYEDDTIDIKYDSKGNTIPN